MKRHEREDALSLYQVQPALDSLDASIEPIQSHFEAREIAAQTRNLLLQRTQASLHVLYVVLDVQHVAVDAPQKLQHKVAGVLRHFDTMAKRSMERKANISSRAPP